METRRGRVLDGSVRSVLRYDTPVPERRASHYLARRPLPRTAGRHLSPQGLVEGLFALPASPHGHRRQLRAAGVRQFLCAVPGAQSEGRGRLGCRRAALAGTHRRGARRDDPARPWQLHHERLLYDARELSQRLPERPRRGFFSRAAVSAIGLVPVPQPGRGHPQSLPGRRRYSPGCWAAGCAVLSQGAGRTRAFGVCRFASCRRSRPDDRIAERRRRAGAQGQELPLGSPLDDAGSRGTRDAPLRVLPLCRRPRRRSLRGAKPAHRARTRGTRHRKRRLAQPGRDRCDCADARMSYPARADADLHRRDHLGSGHCPHGRRSRAASLLLPGRRHRRFDDVQGAGL